MDIAKDYTWLTTVGGWAIIVGAGAFFYSRYNQNDKRKTSAPRFTGQPQKQPIDFGSDAQPAPSKKKAEKSSKPKPKPKPAVAAAPAVAPSTKAPAATYKDDDEADNKDDLREFARQYSTAKAGTTFSTVKSTEKKQKSVKQSKAVEKPAVIEEPSSHPEDADDDLSPAVSPVVGAVNGLDVSDMLEKPAAGPSILRLTDTDVAKPKPKVTKAPEPVETKKQRQNRKKVEAAKAAREQDEKERKALMEQQRRIARVAEGRAAKDGSAFMAQKENAWTAKQENGDSNSASVQPLDTFEPKPMTEKTNQVKPEAASAPKSSQDSDTWRETHMSEEEQIKIIEQEEGAWNEVKTKKKGKKSGPAETTDAVTTEAPSNPAPSKVRTVTNGEAAKKPASLATRGSSFAVLPTEGNDNDDEPEEKEWEV